MGFHFVYIIVFCRVFELDALFLSIMSLQMVTIPFFKIVHRGVFILGKMILEALTEMPTIMAETVRFVFKQMVRVVLFILHWHLQYLFCSTRPCIEILKQAEVLCTTHQGTSRCA